MGILNVTSDSFYAGSRVQSDLDLLSRAELFIREGATFLDIGGQSTRPGSPRLGADEEKRNVLPAIEKILARFPDALVSIDTYDASVAKASVEAGACVVNDISGGEIDAAMFETVASLKVPYILMHMKGTPENMQQQPQYEDVFLEVCTYFSEKVARLRSLGVADIVLDPGFGFGKSFEHNFTLLDRFNDFRIFELPLLAGVSRKSMIRQATGRTTEDALAGTIAAQTIALMKGADILRVHDVSEASDIIKVVQSLGRS